MSRFVLVNAAALSLLASAAMAQTVSSDVTTTITPVPSGPVVVSSTANTANAVRPDGDQTSSSGTASRDSNGVAIESTVTNTSYPFSSLVTTTRKTTSTVNGVATETVTTTQAYPTGTSTVPPTTTTMTRTIPADAK